MVENVYLHVHAFVVHAHASIVDVPVPEQGNVDDPAASDTGA